MNVNNIKNKNVIKGEICTYIELKDNQNCKYRCPD